MKKIIQNVKTRIRNKRQLVIIEFDNNNYCFIMPNQIHQNTGLYVNEVELLIGSTLRVEFYKKGEEMFNKKICTKDNLVIKEYFFELENPVEELRIKKQEKLLPFKKIAKIWFFNKFGKDNVGIETEDESVIFILLKRFEGFSKLNVDEMHILVGSYIIAEYFKKGETLANGELIRVDNRILKGLHLRYSDSIEKMHENFENSIVYFEREVDYSPDYNNYPQDWGYDSWEEMAFLTAFEGDIDAWNSWND